MDPNRSGSATLPLKTLNSSTFNQCVKGKGGNQILIVKSKGKILKSKKWKL
jgi:hypothetical protein